MLVNIYLITISTLITFTKAYTATSDGFYSLTFTKIFSNGTVKAIESDDNTELTLRVKTDKNFYVYNCGEFNVRSNKDRDFSL
jgi:hypothetical protein